VDQVTGFDVQSYATDNRLLDELRAAWPPAEATDAPAGEEAGYVRAELDVLDPVGAVRLTDRFAVALAVRKGDRSGPFDVVPLVRGRVWRRARPGDGLSAFVAGAPMASERAVGVDQTHDSVVVGERAIVKWFRHVGPGPSRASTLLAHLAALGFRGIPAPLGSLAWRGPAGVGLTLAQGDEYLPAARDGWEWCVEHVPHDASIGSDLGTLVDWLHRSLAMPSRAIDEPVGTASPAQVGTWRERAQTTLDQALAVDDDGALAPTAEALRGAIDAIPTDRPVQIQPVHGDLHVGQVLEWSGGLAVIDFDGNPILGDEANLIRQPRERDIAQMLSSIDHVGRILDDRAGGRRTAEVEQWIAATRATFLARIERVDRVLLAAFEVEQECRDLLYAAQFLPRWRYAPLATLRSRYGR